jgi:HKD family nuclease
VPESKAVNHTVLARPLARSAGSWILDRLRDERWTSFKSVAAFLNTGGSKYLLPALHQFTRRSGTSTKFAVGIDNQGSSLEGVQDIWRVLTQFGEFFIYHEGPTGRGSFHPKGYLFEDASGAATVLVGSANLTAGGLYINHELNVSLTFDDPEDPDLAEIRSAFNFWLTPGPTCQPVTAELIEILHNRGDLPTETTQRVSRRTFRGQSVISATTIPPSPFGRTQIPSIPRPEMSPQGLPEAPVTPVFAPAVQGPSTAVSTTTTAPTQPTSTPTGAQAAQFLIEVVPHHNGEVFLSYRAVQENPDFFGYPFTGWTVPKQRRNQPYPQSDPDPVVEIIVYDAQGRRLKRKAAHPLNIVDYTQKREIRVTVPERMHDDIPEMSVLVMTKDPAPHLDYRLEFYPPSAAPKSVVAKLSKTLPTGGKPVARRYGWN